MTAAMHPPEPGNYGGAVPVPDPTKLTTDAVNAATSQWRRDLEALHHVIEVRLDAMDHATELRESYAHDVPKLIDESVDVLERVSNEKFSSISLQFKERDIRTEQAATTSKQALDAALLAAKELVGQQNTANVEAAAKAEASFTKQIDQTSVLIATLEKALTDRILELKERIDRGEGSTAGVADMRTTHRMDSQLGWQIFAALMLVLSVGVTIALAIALHQ